ncbi:DUF6350 family protein [Streptomyces sp. NPDC003300]|uniref:cell division protein PerM n=1 Tax=unclassified Streptomyces TaxID=2593676 RepID=UPI0033BA72A1
MTHTTDRIAALSAEAAARRVAAARATAFAGGAVAAGLGLGVLGAVVLLLWIASPFPDSGLGGALHVGAALWLLAQGADLVRTETLSGAAAPIGVTPLLLTALPGWLLFRAAASAVRTAAGGEDGPRPAADVRTVAATAGWLLGGYLAAASGAVAYAAGGSFRVDVLAALLYVPLFATAVTAAGAWSGCGRPSLARVGPYGREAVVALRAAGTAVGVVIGGGALIGAAALAWHAGAAGRTFAQLSAPPAGQLAVLLVAVALVPNLAVWGASYALGPGFAVGVGSAVAPAGASGYPTLPGFPLLAALPDEGSGGFVGWATLAVPVCAGVLVARSVGRAADAWSLRRTASVASVAALVTGVAFALLAAVSGGPLGTVTLAAFGPSWWAAGLAALAWTLLLGAPGAVALRWHRDGAAVFRPRTWAGWVRALRPLGWPAATARAARGLWGRCGPAVRRRVAALRPTRAVSASAEVPVPAVPPPLPAEPPPPAVPPMPTLPPAPIAAPAPVVPRPEPDPGPE